MRGRASLLGIGLLAGLMMLPSAWGRSDDPRSGPGSRSHRVFFPDTDYELNVYHIRGRLPGPTLLIIGGIHGNEPGGYLAADLYADLTLRRGNLIVVPRANIYSIHQDERGARGDLNRKFGESREHEVDGEIVGVLKGLMRESDAVLNLHDGSGFYDPVWRDDLHNPLRWGQSVIIDADSMSDRDGNRVDLAGIAAAAVEQANAEIDRAGHRFKVNNTHTYQEDSPHLEQRGSATFYAVSDAHIPAFGVETSKEIGDEGVRVEYQVAVINAFLDHFGVLPDHPRFALETPKLHYLAVSVDAQPAVIVEDGGSLAVPPGARVTITHVEANYERGLIVDAEDVGGYSDLGRPFTLERDVRVLVRKDKYLCGTVTLRADPSAGIHAGPVAGTDSLPGVQAFRIRVSGEEILVPAGGRIRVLRGDEIVIGDPLGGGPPDAYRVNFRGFVGNATVNDAEDRGYTVRTASDLLQRFSLSPESERYEVRAEQEHRILASIQIEVTDPVVEYILLRAGDGPLLALAASDTLDVDPDVPLTVTDVVTTPADVGGMTVNFRGFAGPNGAEDRGLAVLPGRDLLPSFSLDGKGLLYEIDITRQGVFLGRAFVRLRRAP